MRLYELDIYKNRIDLDGYALDIVPEIGMIVSLTLCQKELEIPIGIKKYIENRHSVSVKEISKVEYKEEVFFKIIDIVNKDKFVLEFYDYFTNGQIYTPFQQSVNIKYKSTQSKEQYKNEITWKYEEFEVEKLKSENFGKPIFNIFESRANIVKKEFQNDLAYGIINIEDAIDKYNLSYYEVRTLHKEKYINDTQFKSANKKFIKINTQHPIDISSYDSEAIFDHNANECYLGGKITQSKWLKLGDTITSNLNNIHYVPIKVNKLQITKPYHYKFRIVPTNEISEWGGRIFGKDILDQLIPSNKVRCQFTRVDKNDRETFGGVYYFNIISVNNNEITGTLCDYYLNFNDCPDMEQIMGHFITFNKQNISEIPIEFEGNENLNNYKFKNNNYGFAMSGHRLESEDTLYDIFI